VGVTVAMWIAWFLLHMPGVRTDPSVATPILGGVLLLGLLLGVSRTGRGRPAWQIGLLAGLVCGALNLLLLGMQIVEQPESTEQMSDAANKLRPNAALVIAGFLFASTLAGAIAGAVGGSLRSRRPGTDAQGWLGRFGIVSALSMLPLLAVGGAVTGTEAGMSVPDSVTSYGAVSFLFPLSLMGEDRIFLEHSHRLLGSLVGLVTLIWAIYATFVDRRVMIKALTWGVWLLVVVQGVFGIIRVGEDLRVVGAVHGVFAQIVFVFAVGVAAAQTKAYLEAPSLLEDETRKAARRARKLAIVTLFAVLIQLVFGALYRHLGAEKGIHALYSHIGWSFVVFALIIVNGILCMKGSRESRPGATLRRVGVLQHGLVAWQFLLGWAALGMAPPSKADRPIPSAEELASAPPINAVEAIMTTTHQASGALVFGAVMLAVVWSRRLSRPSDGA
jgi:cytochrome c oxidase assembly protein subunit 15